MSSTRSLPVKQCCPKCSSQALQLHIHPTVPNYQVWQCLDCNWHGDPPSPMRHVPNKKRNKPHQHRKNTATPFKETLKHLLHARAALDRILGFTYEAMKDLVEGDQNFSTEHLKERLRETKKHLHEAQKIAEAHPDLWRNLQMTPQEALRYAAIIGENRLRTSAPLRKVNIAKRPDDSDRCEHPPADDYDLERAMKPFPGMPAYPRTELRDGKLVRVEGPNHQPCTKPPRGWVCTREKGHDGPCAAMPEKIGNFEGQRKPRRSGETTHTYWLIEFIPHSGPLQYARVKIVPAVPKANLEVKWGFNAGAATPYTRWERAERDAIRIGATQMPKGGVLALRPVTGGVLGHQERLAIPGEWHEMAKSILKHGVDCDCVHCYPEQV